MRQHTIKWAVWVGLALSLGLVACQQHASVVPTVAPTAPSAPAPAAIAMTPAVQIGSGVLPVDLKFGLPDAPKVGKPFAVRMIVTAATAQPPLLVRWRLDEGLQPVGSAEAKIAQLDASTPAVLDASLAPSTDGIHLVTVDVQLDLAAGAVSREFRFPVLVARP